VAPTFRTNYTYERFSEICGGSRQTGDTSSMKTKILLTCILAAGLFVSPQATKAGGWGGMGGRGFYGGAGHWGGFHGRFYNGYRFYGGGYGWGYPWWGWWPPVSLGVAFYPAPYYGYPFYGYPYYDAPYGGNAYYGNSSHGYYGYTYGTVTQAVQSALARRGYYRGAIDGVLGPETRNAIRTFQAQRGLAVTGQINKNLIRALQT